jgi:hypothetical protein
MYLPYDGRHLVHDEHSPFNVLLSSFVSSWRGGTLSLYIDFSITFLK